MASPRLEIRPPVIQRTRCTVDDEKRVASLVLLCLDLSREPARYRATTPISLSYHLSMLQPRISATAF